MTIITFPPRGPSDYRRKAHTEVRRRWPERLLAIVASISITSAPFVGIMIEESSQISQFRNDGSQRLEVALGRRSVAVLRIHSVLSIRRQGGALYAEVERGQVIFDIREDLRLTVDAGGVTIRDLGTVFSVRVSDSQIEIILGEGEIMVSGHSLQHLVLNDRQQVIVSDESQPEVKSLTLEQLGAEWAWREVAPDTRPDRPCDGTLGAFAQQFNQRGGDQIVVPAPLTALHLSAMGAVRLDNTQGVFELLRDLDPKIKVVSAQYDGHRVLTVSAPPGDVRRLVGNALANIICQSGTK